MRGVLGDFGKRLPIIGRLLCDHPVIKITGVRNGGVAVYQCATCRSRIKPWNTDTDYSPVGTNTTTTDSCTHD